MISLYPALCRSVAARRVAACGSSRHSGVGCRVSPAAVARVGVSRGGVSLRHVGCVTFRASREAQRHVVFCRSRAVPWWLVLPRATRRTGRRSQLASFLRCVLIDDAGRPLSTVMHQKSVSGLPPSPASAAAVGAACCCGLLPAVVGRCLLLWASAGLRWTASDGAGRQETARLASRAGHERTFFL